MKIIFYDKTSGFLSFLWRIGAWIAIRRGHADVAVAVSTWEEMINCIGNTSASLHPLSVIQLWGHGGPGRPLIDSSSLDALRMSKLGAALATHVNMIKIMKGASPIFVWRSCAVFNGLLGQGFARQCARTLQCRVAAFTYNIGWRWGWQSGLRYASPEEPIIVDWTFTEGSLGDGRIAWSESGAPSTIWCMSDITKE